MSVYLSVTMVDVITHSITKKRKSANDRTGRCLGYLHAEADPDHILWSNFYWGRPARYGKMCSQLARHTISASAELLVHKCSSFDNTKVWIFCEFGMKTFIHTQKLVFCYRSIRTSTILIIISVQHVPYMQSCTCSTLISNRQLVKESPATVASSKSHDNTIECCSLPLLSTTVMTYSERHRFRWIWLSKWEAVLTWPSKRQILVWKHVM